MGEYQTSSWNLVNPKHEHLTFMRDEASNTTLSYGQTIQHVKNCCTILQNYKLTKGAIIFADLPSGPPFVILFLSCLQCGFIFSPQNSRLPSQKIQELYTLTSASLFIDKENIKNFIDLSANPSLANFHLEAIDINSSCLLIFSSGTSNVPKGILHNWNALIVSALGSNEYFHINSTHSWGVALPLFHVGGFMIIVRTLLAGASMVFLSQEDLIKLPPINFLSLVPTQLKRLMARNQGEALSKLSAILLGGAGISSQDEKAALKYNIPLHLSYGLSEMASTVSAHTLEDEDTEHVLAGRELAIDQNNRNEILVKGKTLCQKYFVNGYWENIPLDEKGFFHTKDCGEFSLNGKLVISGRLDRMFISGGENIHPEEIERAIMQIEGIEYAQITPMEHAEFGQVPVASIRSSVDYKDTFLREKLKAVLPNYKIPQKIIFLPKNSKTSNAKDL